VILITGVHGCRALATYIGTVASAGTKGLWHHRSAIHHCSLSKASGLLDKTKPVQLIALTMPQVMAPEKVTISYEVSDKLQNHHLRFFNDTASWSFIP